MLLGGAGPVRPGERLRLQLEQHDRGGRKERLANEPGALQHGVVLAEVVASGMATPAVGTPRPPSKRAAYQAKCAKALLASA